MSALFLRTFLVVVITLLPALASAQGLRVLARVNDDAITDFDLQQRVLFAIRTTGLQDSPDLRQRMAAQILRQMIDERLQIQDAKRLGLIDNKTCSIDEDRSGIRFVVPRALRKQTAA